MLSLFCLQPIKGLSRLILRRLFREREINGDGPFHVTGDCSTIEVYYYIASDYWKRGASSGTFAIEIK